MRVSIRKSNKIDAQNYQNCEYYLRDGSTKANTVTIYFILFYPLPTLCQHFLAPLLAPFGPFWPFFAPFSTFFCPLVDGEVIFGWPLQHGFKLHTVADLVNICLFKTFTKVDIFHFRLCTVSSSIICFSLVVAVFVVLEWFSLKSSKDPSKIRQL